MPERVAKDLFTSGSWVAAVVVADRNRERPLSRGSIMSPALTLVEHSQAALVAVLCCDVRWCALGCVLGRQARVGAELVRASSASRRLMRLHCVVAHLDSASA